MNDEIGLHSTFHAISILRDYEIGKPRSIEPNPDKVQISHKKYQISLESGGEIIHLDALSKQHARWILCLKAARELQRLHSNNKYFQSFWVHYIHGVNEAFIAKKYGVKDRTVQKWISEVYRDFTQILVSRGLLEDYEGRDSAH